MLEDAAFEEELPGDLFMAWEEEEPEREKARLFIDFDSPNHPMIDW